MILPRKRTRAKKKKTAAAKEFYRLSIADNLGIKLRELSDEFLKQLQGRMGFWIVVGEGKIENALQVYSILQQVRNRKLQKLRRSLSGKSLREKAAANNKMLRQRTRRDRQPTLLPAKL